MSKDLPRNLPGQGFFGWLGRQVGYVKKAAKTDVESAAIYRAESTQERSHPADPSITLRRTTIDEAVKKIEPPMNTDEHR